jgi:hypothetical protein
LLMSIQCEIFVNGRNGKGWVDGCDLVGQF